MRICVIGAGYVGLPFALCAADFGHSVWCVEEAHERLEALRAGRAPLFEAGLTDLLTSGLAGRRVSFLSTVCDVPAGIDLWVVAVGTPAADDGSADLSALYRAVDALIPHLERDAVVVVKSTVPVGTTDEISSRIAKTLGNRAGEDRVPVAFCPEFLRQGSAVTDTMRPDRIVIGTDDERAVVRLKEFYRPFVRNHDRTHVMSARSAELSKYAANALLAARISFMNEMASLCELVGADIEEVRVAIGSDHRIGTHFLYAGTGFGGSCFPKDVGALAAASEKLGFDATMLKAILQRNAAQKRALPSKVFKAFGADLTGVRLGVWGLAFKPGTDDVRYAPSLEIISELLGAGASLHLHDPVASENTRAALADHPRAASLRWASDPYEAAEGCHGLLLVTEWKLYRSPDFHRLRGIMLGTHIFDGRNQYDPHTVRRAGFTYHGIGRAGPLPDSANDAPSEAL